MNRGLVPRSPRRVLMTADAVGGVWTYAMQLSRGLSERGIEVVIACMGPSPSQAQRSEVPRGAVLETASYALEWMEDTFDQIDDATAWLLALDRVYAPDIVHLNGYAHGAIATRAPRVVVAHSCVGSWFNAVKGMKMPSAYDRYRKRLLAGCAAAQAIVAPTAAMLDALHAAHDFTRDERAVVIPNGIALDTRAPSSKSPLLVAVGRVWDPAKNIETLCSVAPKLSWPVTVIGSTRETRWASDPTAVSNVRFTGHLARDAVRDLLKQAAIFVHPARYEPFGLAPLEAAAAGCALVLGDIPSLREVWGDAATYVPPDDARALQAVLEALIRDPQRRAELAERCRVRALDYPLHTMTEAYVALYARLLTRRQQEPTCVSSSSPTHSSPIGTTAMPTSCAGSSPSSSGGGTTSAASSRVMPGASRTSSAIMA